MGALVHESAAIESPGAPPRGLGVVAFVAVPADLDHPMKDSSEASGFQSLAGSLHGGIEAVLETEGKLAAVGLRGGDHRVGVLGGQGQRLFADDMGPGVQAVDRDARVIAGFGRDGDDVGMYLIQHQSVIGVSRGRRRGG